MVFNIKLVETKRKEIRMERERYFKAIEFKDIKGIIYKSDKKYFGQNIDIWG